MNDPVLHHVIVHIGDDGHAYADPFYIVQGATTGPHMHPDETKRTPMSAVDAAVDAIRAVHPPDKVSIIVPLITEDLTIPIDDLDRQAIQTAMDRL